jgi:hypothetical protein
MTIVISNSADGLPTTLPAAPSAPTTNPTTPAVDNRSGYIKVAYHPKQCFTAPCPQFAVLEVDGVPASGGADLVNINAANSPIAAFQSVLLKGSWTREDDYFRVTVSEWEAVIHERIQPQQNPHLPPQAIPR